MSFIVTVAYRFPFTAAPPMTYQAGGACPPWTAKELEMLRGLAGDLPWRLAASTYNAWAKRHGHSIRSECGLRQKVYKCGLSVVAEGKWLTLAALSTLTGRKINTIRKWISEGKLLGRKWETPSGQGRWYVQRCDLKAFARERPHHLAGMDRMTLFLALEDEELADELAAMPRSIRGMHRPVVCVETGRRFPTISDAARHVHVVEQGISKAMRTGGVAGRFHWRAA